MTDYPAMPWYADAYIADTRHLTLEQNGAYRELLDYAWRHPTCSITTDDRQIARMLGISLNKWRAMKDIILAFWTLEDASFHGPIGPRYIQKKQRLVRKRVEKKVAQRKKAGIASAAAKALKRKQQASTDVLTDVDPPLPPRSNETANETPTTKTKGLPNKVNHLVEIDGKKVMRKTAGWGVENWRLVIEDYIDGGVWMISEVGAPPNMEETLCPKILLEEYEEDLKKRLAPVKLPIKV